MLGVLEVVLTNQTYKGIQTDSLKHQHHGSVNSFSLKESIFTIGQWILSGQQFCFTSGLFDNIQQLDIASY